MSKFIILQGDSTDAHNLLSAFLNKVSLVVTSPPYHNAISYETHATDSALNYRIRESISYKDEYLPLLNKVWSSSWKLLKPGGYLAINVGSVLEKGKHFSLPQDIQSEILGSENDWEFIKNIVWNKVTAGVKRAGTVIKYALPGYWHPNIMTEHIIIFKKPGESHKFNANLPEEWWEPVWDLAPVPPRTIEHPAPFPEEIPHRLIRMLTSVDDLIFDPFNGAGASTKAAYDLQRFPLGIDLELKYVDLAVNRISQNSLIRNEQLKIKPTAAVDFHPGKAKGKTRHGAGKKKVKTK
jgi:site-specific DNA-methyltransferase (adenine-specific)